MKDDSDPHVRPSLPRVTESPSSATESSFDFFDHDRDDREKCPYCKGRGYISVDGGSLSYPCQDCQ